MSRSRCPIWPAIPVLLAGCASLDPAPDLHRTAVLSECRVGADVATVWEAPVDQPSTAWDGTSPLPADIALLVALQNEPEVRIALTRVAERRADLVQAGLPPNPTIGLGIGVAVDGLSGAPAVVQGLQALTWLWTRPDRIAIAQADLQHSILTAAAGAVDLAAQVAAGHARVLAAQERASLDRQNLDIAEQTRSLIERQLHVGEAAPLDVDRADVDVHSARTAVIASTRSLEQAKLALLLDMGWPAHDTSWSAAASGGIAAPEQDQDAALCALAAAQRLDIAAARAAVQRELAELSLAGTKRLPEVQFTFGWQRNFMDRKAVMPGASLTIPIFDRGGPAMSKAVARLEASRLRWIDLANHMEYSVRNAGSTWRQAAAQRHVVELQLLPAAADALARSRAAYAEGVIDLTALLRSQERHIDAQRTLVAHRLAEAEALIELQRAVGGTFDHLPDAARVASTPPKVPS
ncbi:MAG: TolC family protein [Phycisphaerales bacterium]|nr:TolC family protein [Phycisphaerales bacterium]